MYVGDNESTVSDFNASATDKDGNNLDVTADFSKAGTYNVILKATDGQSKTVTLIIKIIKHIVIDHNNNNKDKGNPSSVRNILTNNSKASLSGTGEQKTNLFYAAGVMLIFLALAIYGVLKKFGKRIELTIKSLSYKLYFFLNSK